MKLIVFDLDQTLVDLIPVHDEATKDLFSRCYDVEARLTEIDFAGRSLTDNLAELARLKGIDEERLRKDAPGMLELYETIFAQKVPRDARRYILAGAVELLEAIFRKGYFLALYTGGSKGVVEAVFKATALGRYMKLVVYGTDAPTRADMLRLAIARASRDSAIQFQGRDVVVIGDSVRDVQAGKEVGALTIAVATGFHSKSQLQAAAPGYLFDNLENTEALLQAIG